MKNRNFLEQLKHDKIELVSLQFTDLLGILKEVIVPVKELFNALPDGIWFDGSSVEGFARIQESDLFLKPDILTYSVIPWLTEGGKTARLICDIYQPDGKPFVGDPRLILKKMIEEAEKAGFHYNVGPEPEFYLFKKDDTIKNSPVDFGGYFDFSSYEGYKVVREIIASLKNLGIGVETSHHEVGKGQYEIDFNYGPALQIADKLSTLKYCVKRVAESHGLRATFMPKPMRGFAGCGLHVHQSLFDVKNVKNLFYNKNDKYNLSQIAYNFIAGQMRHIKAMSAILCPTINSYKRLVSGFEAPVYITWASVNRSALIRVPKWFTQKPKSARIELRCPDPTCNPYLTFAVMLKAGLDGIKNNLTPHNPVEENVYHFDNSNLVNRKIDVLPTSLSEALDELKKGSLVKEVLGVHLFERYVDIKTKEWNEFKTQVTDWEINKYLELY